MDLDKRSLLREELRMFVDRRDAVAYFAVVVDFSVYLSATLLAVILEPVWLKGIFSCIAGTMTSTLFVLGHDAAHGSLVSKRAFNQVLGRALLLPALHNYTLWRIQHNRLHHQLPNVRGYNSWSPASWGEFRAMRPWRRQLERVYRGGGFGLYYLVERWWRDKLIPKRVLKTELRAAAWFDLILIGSWLATIVAALTLVGSVADGGNPITAVLWGFVLPYAVWNCHMGLTVYLQHTHPAVPWFRTEEEARAYGGQDKLTVHVEYPRWYGWLSHDIMEHPAHHINPLIPFYRLHKAQTRLVQILGDEAIVEHIGLRYLRLVMRRCKLYNYDRQEWVDFSGRPTGQIEGDAQLMAAQRA